MNSKHLALEAIRKVYVNKTGSLKDVWEDLEDIKRFTLMLHGDVTAKVEAQQKD